MADGPKMPLRERRRQFAQDAILDAAEALLERDMGGEFSMRALAEEAGVSFATPFNYFGSKRAIVLGLAHRIIVRIRAGYGAEKKPDRAIDRLFLMARVGVDEILERPFISRPVISALATIDGHDGTVRARSRELWKIAFGDFCGIPVAHVPLCNDLVPDQLAISFRGCLSFWVGGEIENEDLLLAVNSAIAIQMLGVLPSGDRHGLLQYLSMERSILRELVAD